MATLRTELEQTVHPLDSELTRNRKGRNKVFALSMIAVPVTTTLFSGTFLNQFFENAPIMWTIGAAVGFSAGIGLNFYLAEKFFIIRNSTTGLFVTQDVIRSLFGKDGVNVTYGPGTHFSYFWERRLKENNISLFEAAIPFEFQIPCVDGIIFGKGSYRARPRSSQAVRFLTGVASATDDITSLIVADILKRETGKTVDQIERGLGDLNDHLGHFSEPGDDDKQSLEDRFGLEIGDVTVDKLLPSEELQRTRSAVSEANSITKGMWILLGVDGYKNPAAEVRKRIKAGEFTQADVNLARDRFLSISGNLEGMQIDRKEYDLSIHGIDKDLVSALHDFAKTPAAQAVAGAFAAGRSSNSGKRKPQNTKKGASGS